MPVNPKGTQASSVASTQGTSSSGVAMGEYAKACTALMTSQNFLSDLQAEFKNFFKGIDWSQIKLDDMLAAVQVSVFDFEGMLEKFFAQAKTKHNDPKKTLDFVVEQCFLGFLRGFGVNRLANNPKATPAAIAMAGRSVAFGIEDVATTRTSMTISRIMSAFFPIAVEVLEHLATTPGALPAKVTGYEAQRQNQTWIVLVLISGSTNFEAEFDKWSDAQIKLATQIKVSNPAAKAPPSKAILKNIVRQQAVSVSKYDTMSPDEAKAKLATIDKTYTF